MVYRLNLWRAVVGAGQPWHRRAVAIAVVTGVVVVHVCIAEHVGDRMMDFTLHADMPERIEAVYVREMEPTAPAKATAVPRKKPPAVDRPHVARAAASAASAAEQVVAMAEEPMPAVPEPTPPEPAASQSMASQSGPEASEPAPNASAPAPAAAAASAALPVAGAGSVPAFSWPVSTKLSYVLSGNYQGEIHGTAQVEWIRIGNRYQVHLDVTVGLSIFPLLSRKMTSDGHLTPEGLSPYTYDEDSKVVGRDRRRSTIRFEPDAIVMPDGRRRERWPGVQDSASQFVQFTYLFTMRPELLTPGNSIEVPLALPRNVDRWVYDVLDTETLYTPFGAVDGVHLKPRRVARKGSDLTAEIWFAPSLAYLPVRIRIQQDANTFIDLMIRRKPQLASQ